MLDSVKTSLILLLAFVAVCIGLALGARHMYRSVGDIARNAYAADWVSEFVIQHLKNNNNRWPSGWDDLRDEFEAAADPGHYPWPWEELQRRVTIQWDADPTALARADAAADPPFRVIMLSDGKMAHYGEEPNRKVFKYLQTTEFDDVPEP